MPNRYHSFELEGSPDWSALEGRVEELEAILTDLKLQVQTLLSGAASVERVQALEARIFELERYNMPMRMADMSMLLAELNAKVKMLYPRFSFMRWLRSFVS